MKRSYIIPSGIDPTTLTWTFDDERAITFSNGIVTLYGSINGYQEVLLENQNVIPVVPQVVTMRQARLALLAAGLYDLVSAAVAGAGQAAIIEWEYAQDVDRRHGLIPTMAAAMGLSEEQLDTLFISASTF